MKGNIKWYNARKGYGFITGEDGKDIFVHKSDIPVGVNLNEKDPVEYEIEESDRGLKAKNVKTAKAHAEAPTEEEAPAEEEEAPAKAKPKAKAKSKPKAKA